MASKQTEAKRRQANRFAKRLDERDVIRWLKHKETNPHVKCNAEFQRKVDHFTRYSTEL
jgi:exoribonuclease II